jgi:predicted glycosyltransferase
MINGLVDNLASNTARIVRQREHSRSVSNGAKRVAMYSHDTMGLGHIRRNMLIASSFTRWGISRSILLITGTREACAYTLPAGVDCLSLPALCKESDGQYHSRHLSMPLEHLNRLRAQTIAAALASFDPDVLIVDKVPRGACGELELALTNLRRNRRTACILGLRDVLDDPLTVRREWHHERNEEAVRHFYDGIWVYGDKGIYDQASEYSFAADLASKIRYTGYLMRPQEPFGSENGLAEFVSEHRQGGERMFLCLVGGGQDGYNLAQAFAQVDFPSGVKGVILCGPFMPADAFDHLGRMAAVRSRLKVLKFVTDSELLISLADRVVAMGGYNTICEILNSRRPALIVPRVLPRREQLIRAQRLKQRGLIDLLEPDRVSPQSLGEWLQRDLSAGGLAGDRINLNGADNVSHFLGDLLGEAVPTASKRHSERY